MAVDPLDYFPHGEEQGTSQPPQDEEEQHQYRPLNPQQEVEEKEIELEEEDALPDDPIFSLQQNLRDTQAGTSAGHPVLGTVKQGTDGKL